MRIRDGVRQTMAWLHGWAGLLLGWVLYVMSLAGTLSVFRPEIGAWMRPEATNRAPAIEALAAAVRWLSANGEKAPAWFLAAPGPREPTVQAVWFKGTDYIVRALDPVSGAPVARQTLGGEFFYRLHFELELPYPWGRLIASLAAVLMLTAIITGIIAHRRFFRDFFTFRPGRGQRAWLDAHNAMGVLALPFHLMITFTGLVTLASLAMPWGIVANYGKDTAAAFHDIAPGAVDRPAAGKPAPLGDVTAVLREAERRFHGGAIGRISLLNPGDAAAVMQVYQAEDGQLVTTPHEISFDAVTGRVLADHEEHRAGLETYGVVYGLHLARFAPPLLRWLYFLGGLALTGVIGSGLVLWVVKRRERAPLARGNRLVERLNVGTIAGAPIAFAAYFWANRLLPLGGGTRDAQEVAAVFWIWGAAALAALLMPPRWSWHVLLWLAAAAWVALPLAEILVWHRMPSGDWAIADAMMVVTAAMLGLAARRAAA